MDSYEDTKVEYYPDDDSQMAMQVYIPAYPSLDPPFVQCPPIDPCAPTDEFQQVRIIQSPIEFQGLNEMSSLKNAAKWGTIIFIISFFSIVSPYLIISSAESLFYFPALLPGWTSRRSTW